MTSSLRLRWIALAAVAAAGVQGQPAAASTPQCVVSAQPTGEQITCVLDGLVSSCAFFLDSVAGPTVAGSSAYTGTGEQAPALAERTAIRCRVAHGTGTLFLEAAQTTTGNLAFAQRSRPDAGPAAYYVCVEGSAEFGFTAPPIVIEQSCNPL